MLKGTNVNFIYQTRSGEFSSAGVIEEYIAPDRESGERVGAFIITGDDGQEYEVDERDVWEAR